MWGTPQRSRRMVTSPDGAAPAPAAARTTIASARSGPMRMQRHYPSSARDLKAEDDRTAAGGRRLARPPVRLGPRGRPGAPHIRLLEKTRVGTRSVSALLGPPTSAGLAPG